MNALSHNEGPATHTHKILHCLNAQSMGVDDDINIDLKLSRIWWHHGRLLETSVQIDEYQNLDKYQNLLCWSVCCGYSLEPSH